ncbi:hypothetical protein [Streptomyces sp. NPDC020377]|uniref:hypothetical protein n=1 Tax=Streptomyces sp. NPDC020377 TaxID=3365070 RepID=UPI0037B3ECF1
METAALVESLDVVARMLKEQLGAAAVSFLITDFTDFTDFTGGSVVRLGVAGSVDTDEPARRIPLRGTLYDDVIRTQWPSVENRGDGALVRIVAPVTNRGDAIGLLEPGRLPRRRRWPGRAPVGRGPSTSRSGLAGRHGCVFPGVSRAETGSRSASRTQCPRCGTQ